MRLLIVGLSSLILSACNPFVDDQRNLPENLYTIANPTPTKRNFKAINDNHKILVAVIDSGVDYNHDYLRKSMHFDLDENNNPVGIGWDYLGDDEWASPYLARTGNVDQTLHPLFRKISQSNFDLIERAIQQYPKLSTKISPYRLLEGEVGADAYHGTHVAGILADDGGVIGIVPYRISPVPILRNENELGGQTLIEFLFKRYLDAHKKAYDKGIRIINISMAFNSKAGDTDEGFSIKPETIQRLMQEYKAFLSAHPDLLIVGSSGNDHVDLADEEKFQMPCGIKHPQILCVGSVNSQGERSDFGNVFSGYDNFVNAFGEGIWAAYPMNYCDPEFSSQTIKVFNVEVPTILKSPFRQLNFNEAFVSQHCMRIDRRMEDFSGTSMATPKIAQKAALILLKNPTFTPKEIIETLKKSNL